MHRIGAVVVVVLLVMQMGVANTWMTVNTAASQAAMFRLAS